MCVYIKINLLLSLGYHPKDPDIPQHQNYVTSYACLLELKRTPHCKKKGLSAKIKVPSVYQKDRVQKGRKKGPSAMKSNYACLN